MAEPLLLDLEGSLEMNCRRGEVVAVERDGSEIAQDVADLKMVRTELLFVEGKGRGHE